MGNFKTARMCGLKRAHLRIPFYFIQPERLAGGLHA